MISNTPAQVTPWRQQLAQALATIVSTIEQTAAPEGRHALARFCAEDLRHEIAQRTRKEYGRVFDPLVDGPELRS